MRSVLRDTLDDPLPDLLDRFRPADAFQLHWVERLAFATRSGRRVARALEAVRARTGEGGGTEADRHLLESLRRYGAQVARGERAALAELARRGSAGTAPAATPVPVPQPRPAPPARQARAAVGPRPASVLRTLPSRPLRVRGKSRPRFVVPPRTPSGSAVP